jgi:hypothetical protein
LDKTAIQIREVDHVATAVVELGSGETVVVSGVRAGRHCHAVVALVRSMGMMDA